MRQLPRLLASLVIAASLLVSGCSNEPSIPNPDWLEKPVVLPDFSKPMDSGKPWTVGDVYDRFTLRRGIVVVISQDENGPLRRPTSAQMSWPVLKNHPGAMPAMERRSRELLVVSVAQDPNPQTETLKTYCVPNYLSIQSDCSDHTNGVGHEYGLWEDRGVVMMVSVPGGPVHVPNGREQGATIARNNTPLPGSTVNTGDVLTVYISSILSIPTILGFVGVGLLGLLLGWLLARRRS